MKTILIVDDQERIRNTYRQVLAKDGYHVLVAASAHKAYETVRSEHIDILLLDIRMPKVDGVTLYEITRSFHADVKIIVCSVYPLDDQKHMIHGADGYFDKSEGINMLRRKISGVLAEDTRKKRILIIDDEQKVRKNYTVLFKKEGYLTRSFGDTETAMHYVNDPKARVDLLILDLAMPHIDGCNFFEVMKDLHPLAKIMVASNYSIDTQQFMVFDADDYFDKTDGNALLLSKVRALME